MPNLPTNRRLLSSQHFHRLEDFSLLTIQMDSFQRFVDKYLPELFEEISPIVDFTGKNYELDFSDIFFIIEPSLSFKNNTIPVFPISFCCPGKL